LPDGTAYISDVGMVGCVNSVIGIRKDQGVQRFLTSRPQRFEPQKGDGILSAVCIEIDVESGKACSIKRENITEEKDGG
jgi:calcineurin-like phosphoesterase